MTRRLIESWLPIAALGEESIRERRSMTALPPIYYLHVWWARRPLVASRAAILASFLPEDVDKEKFLRILGIHGDPVAAKIRIANANREGVRLGVNAYGYNRAFSYNPDPFDKEWLKNEFLRLSITKPTLLDPTAGGGSIPLEASRVGLNVFASDLNPVASLILKATVEWPRTLSGIQKKFDELGSKLLKKVKSSLINIFPDEPTDIWKPDGYLWAKTIKCPYCNGLIPLSPNWKLSPNGTGIKILPDTIKRICSFEIVSSVNDLSKGTVSRGDASCPFPDCGRVIDGKEVKKQAQAGKMGDQLYCVVFKELEEIFTKTGKSKFKWVRKFRGPRPEDHNKEYIKKHLEEKLPEWEAWDMVPVENIEDGHKTSEPLRYGYQKWSDLFNPRQLIFHATVLQEYRNILSEYGDTQNLDELTKAVFVYLSFSLDKLLNYNSRMSIWHTPREVIANTFSKHDFAFAWSYAEMPPYTGLDWAIGQTSKCIKELSSLIGDNDKAGIQNNLFFEANSSKVNITCQSADDLRHLDDRSVDVVVMDPPYYDNVMYAELSDFFYVWLKRSAGYVIPELFVRQLSDKENEAVANPAQFQGQKGAKALAGKHYQDRMKSIFAECRRVLKDDGVMTLMFTHKAVGAWDALTKGLLEAGFTITASWPINTEAEGSLHIKDKAAANSTIFLVCRLRTVASKEKLNYWEEVEPKVKKAVRDKVAQFKQAGIIGVDLYLSCFGPALEEFAKHWPLQRGNPREDPTKKKRQQSLLIDSFDPYEVTPEDALEAARKEVKQWRMEQLLKSQRLTELDTLAEWFVLAWDSFKSPQFPYDEGLRLARVVGIDLDTEIVGRIAEKKTSNLIIWDSVKRAAKGTLGPPDGSRSILDALHHAANRARNMNLESARELLEESGVSKQPNFEASLLAVLEVLPVSSTFTKIEDSAGPVADAASDFDVLEHLRRLAFSEKVPEPEQLSLWK